MEISARLQALCELAEDLGIEIRAEPMGGEGGGLCELRGRRVLFVDTVADLAERYDRTLAALAPLPEVEQRYLLPELRHDLERQRSENKIAIRKETERDHSAIRQLLGQAFGSDNEAHLVEQLRHDNSVLVSLVAVAGGQVVGQILFSELTIETDRGFMTAAALAPLAVLPDHQRKGIGSKLIRAGLDECKKIHRTIVIVVGHPEYYEQFGFRAELAKSLKSTYSGDACMAIELEPGALKGIKGTVKYPPAFEEL